MLRFLLAGLVIPSLAAPAGIIYLGDARAVSSFFCFQPGGGSVLVPNPLFSPFIQTVTSTRIDEFGSFVGSGQQESSLHITSMGGSGVANASANTSGLSNCDAGGSTKFILTFRVPVKSNIRLEGTLTGSAARSTLLAEIRSGPAPMFKTTQVGSFLYTTTIPPARSYTVTVSGACNAAINFVDPPFTVNSSAAFSVQLSAAPACQGDLNSDDQVDDSDFSIFTIGYNTLDCADPSMPPGCAADINGDGFVDDADFSIFVVTYDVLICP